MINLNSCPASKKDRISALAFALGICLTLSCAGATPASTVSNTSISQPSVSLAPSNVSEMSITAPSDGATVSGSLTVSANASDTNAIIGVQIQVDDSNLGQELFSAPYSTIWDTSTLTNGIHTLRVVARDAMGYLATGTPVTVAVHNDAENGGPSDAIR